MSIFGIIVVNALLTPRLVDSLKCKVQCDIWSLSNSIVQVKILVRLSELDFEISMLSLSTLIGLPLDIISKCKNILSKSNDTKVSSDQGSTNPYHCGAIKTFGKFTVNIFKYRTRPIISRAFNRSVLSVKLLCWPQGKVSQFFFWQVRC